MTRLRLATLAATLTLPLAVASCGGDDPEPRMPSSSASPSPSSTPPASPDAAAEPTLPPEAEGNDEAAAEAFVRYYWELVHYAESTGDIKSLSRLSLPSCAGCSGGETFVKDMYAQGGYSRGGAYTISEFKVDMLSKSPTLRTFNTEFEKLRAPTVQRATSADPEKTYGADNSSVSMSLTWDKGGFNVGQVSFE